MSIKFLLTSNSHTRVTTAKHYTQFEVPTKLIKLIRMTKPQRYSTSLWTTQYNKKPVDLNDTLLTKNYADDMNILSRSKKSVKEALANLNEVMKEISLRKKKRRPKSWYKPEEGKVNLTKRDTKRFLRLQVDSFLYLGRTLIKENEEINE